MHVFLFGASSSAVHVAEQQYALCCSVHDFSAVTSCFVCGLKILKGCASPFCAYMTKCHCANFICPVGPVS